MTQTVPATCVLGPGKTGLTIGLRVLNLDGTTYAAFATTNVAETSIAGTYRKAGGVVVPAAGGYIVWGEAATDYAEATVDSTSANVTYQAGQPVAAADGYGNIPVNVKRWRDYQPQLLDSGGNVLANAQEMSGTALRGFVIEDTGETTAVAGSVAALAGGLSADDVLDEIVEGTYTLRQMMRIVFAALAGQSAGGGSTAVTFRDVADAKDRITATVDASGNRTAVTLDAT